jgi:hypothetical protein
MAYADSVCINMRLAILLLALFAYANCTLGLLAALAGGFGGYQQAPSRGPIVISNNY